MEYPKGWEVEEEKLTKVFNFEDFVEAFEFVEKIVPLAEKANHHPDILIFSYNKVKVMLVTHDEENQITEKDISLAKKIEEIEV
jgi:4a-hydroxytetrahydrobiopterin dehydratase